MSDPADRRELAEVNSEHGGTRVWSVTGASQQALTDRVAVVLAEHMAPDDELHVNDGVVKTGS